MNVQELRKVESATTIAQSNLFADTHKFESTAKTVQSFAFAHAQSNERREII